MGFYFRKSFKCGPLRLNLSKSGIGTSIGVKGLRYGVNAKGQKYMHTGLNGFYCKETFKDSESENISQVPSPLLGFQGLYFFVYLFLIFVLIANNTNFLTVVFFAIALLPTCISSFNLLPKTKSIFWINIFTFWTVIIPFVQLLFVIKQVQIYKKYKKSLNAIKDRDYMVAIQNLKSIETKIYTVSNNLGPLVKEHLFNAYIGAQMFDEALLFLDANHLENEREKRLGIYSFTENYPKVIEVIQKEYTNREKENNPILIAMLGSAFMGIGKNDIALQTLLNGPVSKRKMTNELSVFRYVLAECYEANGDKANALKQYKKIYAYDITYKDVAEKIEKLLESKE